MGVKRKQHSAEFKARVAMAALSGEKTLAELSAEGSPHTIPSTARSWLRGWLNPAVRPARAGTPQMHPMPLPLS